MVCLVLRTIPERRRGATSQVKAIYTDWSDLLTAEDRRGLTPLFWQHVLPYGEAHVRTLLTEALFHADHQVSRAPVHE